MQKILFSLIYLVMVLLLPGWVWARQVGNEDILLTGGLRQVYDDNITYAESDPKADYITSLVLGIGAQHSGKTGNFKLSGNISRNIFAKNTDFDNTSEDLSFDLNKEFSRYDRLSLKNTFSHADEPRSFEEELGRTSGRYSTYRNIFNASLTHDVTRQFSLIGRYANDSSQYSRKDLRHTFLNSVGLEADYAFSSMTMMFLSYDFIRRQFVHGAHALTRAVSMGLRQYLSSKVYLDAAAGMNYIQSYTNTKFSRPSYSASLTNDIDENTSARIAFKKEYQTRSYESDIFNYWESSGAFSRRLLERLAVSLSAYYGKGEYISFNIKDTVKGAGVSFPYDVWKDAKLTLGYAYSQTTSNLKTREYEKNTVSAGFTLKF